VTTSIDRQKIAELEGVDVAELEAVHVEAPKAPETASPAPAPIPPRGNANASADALIKVSEEIQRRLRHAAATSEVGFGGDSDGRRVF
jgi:hypothetical protein